MEFTRVGPHGKKRLGEGTKNRWVVRREKLYTCKPGLVSRAVYVSSHFIFGIFYEVGTINSTVFFQMRKPRLREITLSMGFSRQEYWSGLLCPPPGDLPDPGIEPVSLKSPSSGPSKSSLT